MDTIKGAVMTTPTPTSGEAPDLRRCIECGKRARLVGGQRIYPHRTDLYAKRFFLCDCGAYVGCHRGTDNPMGYPAGAETRRARSAAHEAFDPIWKTGRLTRRQAYHWLADRMGTLPGQTHISWMSAPEAQRVVIYSRALMEVARQALSSAGIGGEGE